LPRDEEIWMGRGGAKEHSRRATKVWNKTSLTENESKLDKFLFLVRYISIRPRYRELYSLSNGVGGLRPPPSWDFAPGRRLNVFPAL
jgi:hypothetical protein